MASSSGNLSSSINSQTNFSFSTQFVTSNSSTGTTTHLLANNNCRDMNSINEERATTSWGPYAHVSNNSIGGEIPKFKSTPPPSLPSPTPVSPSSFLAIPPGLSPAELLDSPMLFSDSSFLSSPTTGAFAGQTFNWRTNSGDMAQEKSYNDFSFQPTQARPLTTVSSSNFQSSSNVVSVESVKRQEEFSKPTTQTGFSSDKTGVKTEFAPVQSTPFQTNMQGTSAPQSGYGHSTIREQRRADDGYSWRKYGQKQVKGSENPRSYYKCTHPNCPTKKKVESSLDGQITEIVYKGNHNHPKPQSTRRSNSNLVQPSVSTNSGFSDQSGKTLGNTQVETIRMQDDSSISIGEDNFDHDSPISNSVGNEDESEPNGKRWKGENENDVILACGSRTVREPRIVVQTTSDIDILDDGYRWRKYGQKVVKGNPNPRSYYKCTSSGCPVRKHVERASHDMRAVITTYEGKHNHDVPAARGSGYTMNKPPINTNSSSAPMPIRPSAIANHSNHTSFPNSLNTTKAIPTSSSQSPFTLEMLQSPGSFGFSGFGELTGNYMSQEQQPEGMFFGAKEEPKDDNFFESFLRLNN
ncbi:RNI-like superfamily protein [Tripterygium wilfordii]|uniref:RNI-like superfamily protein n=1 Tax=Tripterygium wilfordii TaxID=458696 RepID=A0A7J7DWK5_TRIWF|nr:probable WRKY transcription factor 33 [Tripterygium wilfordii]KAF5750768.1 RNI-like superfamily protein [Tripterygium wilfordii]